MLQTNTDPSDPCVKSHPVCSVLLSTHFIVDCVVVFNETSLLILHIQLAAVSNELSPHFGDSFALPIVQNSSKALQ